MNGQKSGGDSQLQEQIDAIRAQITVNRGTIDELLARADASALRADASQSQSDTDRLRIEDLEAHADIDREMVLELHTTGVLKTEEVVQLKEALRTSRRIGAAIGIIMNEAVISEDDAFALLRRASQNGNRKLRDIADELVLTGDTSGLGRAQPSAGTHHERAETDGLDRPTA